MTNVVAARTTSAFPISIGTCLAVESVFTGGGEPFDPARTIPQHITLDSYHEFWINVSTLFRNLLGSVQRSDIESVRAEDVASGLLEELQLLGNLTREQSNNTTKAVFYVSNYSKLASKYKYAGLRQYATPKQKQYKDMHDKSIQKLINLWPDSEERIRIFDMDLDGIRTRKALLISHVPYDLLSYRRFDTLDLLESHTGLLKQRNMWYTKYYNKNDYIGFPFSKHLLPALGDNEFFHPMSRGLRADIIALAKERHWSWATTDAKILTDLQTLKNDYAKEIINAMTA